MKTPLLWRALFLVGAALISYGGPQHPDGTMLEMLRDPAWVPSHAYITVGFFAFLAGLFLWGRALPDASGVRRAWRWALVVTGVQCVEWVSHTIASIDADRLAAGATTPFLTTHLALTFVVYPTFALGMSVLIWKAAREGLLGSRWIAPVGIFGLACHGAAPWAVMVLAIPGAGILFPMVMFFALWMALAALWPVSPANPPPATRSTER